MMKHTSKLHLPALLILAFAMLAVACMEDPPAAVESFNVAEYHMQVEEADAHKASLFDDIARANERIDIAVSTLGDEELAQALIDARDAGVEVRVVGDWDARDEPGFALLDEQELFPVFGDGALGYLPEPTLSSIVQQCNELDGPQFIQCSSAQGGSSGNSVMVRPGHYNLMSHNFAVIDGEIVWTFPPPDTAQRSWVGWRIESSQLAYDYTREFQQMHGGVFATTLTVYNGPLKSNTNSHTHYLTDSGIMRVWFNPQQRLLKTIIDEVYKAKASVWVMSDNIVNPDLLDALEYKDDNGFDVRLMSHPANQASGEAKSRLESMGLRDAPDNLDHLPTLIIIDAEVDRNGTKRPRKVLSLSHPLIRAKPFEVEYREPNDRVNVFPSDQFVDGNLWQVLESGTTVHKDETIDGLKEYWLQIYDSSN